MKRNEVPFWSVGYALLVVLAGSNIPSPLYGVYKEAWGFSSGLLTLVFAVYALAIVPTLLVFGRLSDRFGRKAALVPGLLAAFAGSVLFALARDVTGLLAARAVQGLAVGIVSGAATAALTELHPRGERRTAALVAAVAPRSARRSDRCSRASSSSTPHGRPCCRTSSI
ncbi:MFS transporter [Paenibacillus flagellatus]|nr:MFS transporter [Paenibacillus flagellatus]